MLTGCAADASDERRTEGRCQSPQASDVDISVSIGFVGPGLTRTRVGLRSDSWDASRF